MKKVLIVGENSYIGKSFAAYASSRFEITAISVRDDRWKKLDFSSFDSILHCVGIAHVKTTKENEHLYYQVNCDLALEVAKKAKGEGVKHFVFLSSIFVYLNTLKANFFINNNTKPNPSSIYGKSKYKAEVELQKLEDDNFKVCLVRPPMVYGKNCKGNFPSLVKLAKLLPVFPNYPNKRSMVYIYNLCEHLCMVVENRRSGATMPHNTEYVSTTQLVTHIRKAYGKRTYTTKLFNPIIRLFVKHISVVNKMFGDLGYEMDGDEKYYEVAKFGEGATKSIQVAQELDEKNGSSVRKKVLFVTTIASSVWFSESFLKWFKEQGWEVHYASLGGTGKDYIDTEYNVPFSRSPFKLSNICAYRQMKQIIEKEKYDIIHCHTPVAGVVTRLAARKARKKCTKVIYTAHGFHFYEGAPLKNWLLYYPAEKLMARYTDCLITINSEDYEIAKRKFRANRIYKVNGVGVDMDKFSPVNASEKADLRERYGYNDDDFILIYAAEFNPDKNHRFVIEAMPQLSSVVPAIKVLFCGIGKLQNDMIALSQKLGVQNHIDFLGFRDDMPELYRLSDVLVSPSVREGLGINVIEGAASGLPLVLVENRGHNEIIEDGINGILIRANDVTGFIKAIVGLHSNHDYRHEMGSCSIKSVEKYSIVSAVPMVTEIYEWRDV